METNKTSVLFIGSGAVGGGSIAGTYGGIGLVGSFGGMSLGAFPLATAGAIVGAAASGAIAAIQDRDAVAITAVGIGTLGGVATYSAVGGVGLGIGGTAFGIGMGTMATLGGIVGLGVYGVAKMLGGSNNTAQLYANLQAIADIRTEYELEQKFIALETDVDVEKELAKLKAQMGYRPKAPPEVSSYFLWGKNQNWHDAVKPKAQTQVVPKQPLLEFKLQLKHAIGGQGKAIECFALSPDAQTLATARNNGQIQLYNLQTRRHLYTFFGCSLPIEALVITPDSKQLIAGDTQGNITIWELATKQLLHTFNAHKSLITCIICSKQNIITASADKTIKIWQQATGRLKRTLAKHQDTIYALTLSKDGKILASGSADTTIRIWKLDSYQEPTLIGVNYWVTSLAFTPDSKLLVSADTSGCLKFWDWQTHTLLNSVNVDTTFIPAIAISPTENLLAIDTRNHLVKLWQLPTGTFISELPGISPLAFSSDGQTLVTCREGDGVSIWQLS